MKYIKYRKDFLLNKVPENRPKEINYNDSVILKEGMENDITWGGSLLGRLVNSTIRIGKILTKRVGIKKLIKNVRFELDQILYENGLSEETKKEANLIRFRLLIKEIHNVVISNDKVDSKVTQLIADGKTDKDGLLNQVIIEIEGIDESKGLKRYPKTGI